MDKNNKIPWSLPSARSTRFLLEKPKNQKTSWGQFFSKGYQNKLKNQNCEHGGQFY